MAHHMIDDFNHVNIAVITLEDFGQKERGRQRSLQEFASHSEGSSVLYWSQLRARD